MLTGFNDIETLESCIKEESDKISDFINEPLQEIETDGVPVLGKDNDSGYDKVLKQLKDLQLELNNVYANPELLSKYTSYIEQMLSLITTLIKNRTKLAQYQEKVISDFVTNCVVTAYGE